MPTIKQPENTRKGLPEGDRVWIELERFAGDDVCERRAKRASAMLQRMGFNAYQGRSIIWWHPAKSHYCITVDEAGGFLEMGDSGHWFYFDQIERLAENQKPRPLDEILNDKPADSIATA